MIKHLAIATAFTFALAGAASAQTAAPAPAGDPTVAASSQDDCIGKAVQLGQMAEAKTIAKESLTKLDDLFSKLETHCDANQFSEAASVAGDIKKMIDAN